ncbi:hypothetical protein, partial [Methanoculleus sp.]|uniref:hypothetical protein n=1 Tax=Methanoculleus sp. TaxID=90427 RepID=UPI00262CD7D9
ALPIYKATPCSVIWTTIEAPRAPIRSMSEPSPASLSAALSTHPWFGELADAHRTLVLETARLVHFGAGEFVARRNAPSADWIGVHRGLVKLAVYP